MLGREQECFLNASLASLLQDPSKPKQAQLPLLLPAPYFQHQSRIYHVFLKFFIVIQSQVALKVHEQAGYCFGGTTKNPDQFIHRSETFCVVGDYFVKKVPYPFPSRLFQSCFPKPCRPGGLSRICIYLHSVSVMA